MAQPKTSRKQRTKPKRTAKLPEDAGSARTALLLLGLAIVAVFFLSYLNRLQDLSAVEASVEARRADVELAQQRNAALRDELDYVKGDDYVAQIARSELGLSQPGDEVYTVIEDETQDGAGQPVVSQSLVEQPEAGEDLPASKEGFRPFDLDWWRSLFR